ncbi:hypothetical protein EVAR_24483_1 [Eumeta japonica]|uniref:Uncharacterized protein n=1 Tax=Eumeta variegata TaxID=151549 RepID=A0A4C1WYT8_EUMVA|nr:hypothetical protein EVAR_24483_1 [Eumeta japonica]
MTDLILDIVLISVHLQRRHKRYAGMYIRMPRVGLAIVKSDSAFKYNSYARDFSANNDENGNEIKERQLEKERDKVMLSKNDVWSLLAHPLDGRLCLSTIPRNGTIERARGASAGRGRRATAKPG